MSEHLSNGRLRYRPDWLEARQRLAAWWDGADLGRPALMIEAPRIEPWEPIEPLAPPWPDISRYTSRSLAWRVYQAKVACVRRQYLGEACPKVATGDVGPGSLALYLGCEAVEAPDTVWFEPCIDQPEDFVARFDPDNRFWRFTSQVLDEVAPWSSGRFLNQFPDLIEGLDIIAALRGTEPMLYDLFDRPEWIEATLAQITALYFQYYDLLYDRIRDDLGGCVFWTWAPGRLAKLQTDCSAMLSPQQFTDFQIPVLAAMCERLDYSIYHLDGVDAVKHVSALLELDDLDVVQWTPGAGQPPVGDATWYDLYARILEAGKRVFLLGLTPEQAVALKRRFAADSHRFLLALWLGDVETGEQVIRDLER